MADSVTFGVPIVTIVHVVEPWLSDEVTSICKWLLFTILSQLIAIFGTGANIFNIVCFIKLGFNDAVNISFLGLAVADLCCLVTLVWTNICITPPVSTSDLPFDPLELQYLVSGIPHTTFTRVSAWITAVITLERCLCIIAPLKVKQIITPRRMAALIVSVFVLLLASVAPFYCVNLLQMKYSLSRNKTILGLVYTSNRESVEQVSFSINNVLITFGAFFVTIICTALLVVRLRQLTKWRQTSVAATKEDSVSKRNLKVARMVVRISVLFIACFMPVTFIFIAIMLEPEFSLRGKYRNINLVCSGVVFLTESINSSVNIFIYYHMSSKYKHVLLQTCCFKICRQRNVDKF